MPVYLVDKPIGASSHDVVATARRELRTRRVGHAGTLDPLATGLLVLLVDEATKLSPFLTGSRKRYLAWVSFGGSTPTLDAEGPLMERSEVVDLTEGRIRAALSPFLALREQVPPSFSAVKRSGERSYRAARRGDVVDLPARAAGYRSIDLLALAPSLEELPRRVAPAPEGGGWGPDPKGRSVPLPEALGTFPSALLALEVEPGTYIRSFARDLGEALEVPSFLAGLLRTGAGQLDLADAVPPELLGEAVPVTTLDALPYPRVDLDEEAARRVRQGQRLPLSFSGRAALIDPDGRLVAVAEEAEGRMKLLRVWHD